jgi:IgGFc binding protein
MIFCFLNLFDTKGEEYKRSNFEGRHFIVAFPDNEIIENGISLQKIYISARQEAIVSIKMGTVYDTLYIKDGSIQSFEVYPELEIIADSSGKILEDKTIEIRSDNPVVVSCLSSQLHSSDMYTAIPVSNWGRDYITMNMGNDFYEIKPEDSPNEIIRNSKPRSGEFMILASENQTEVKVDPSAESGFSNSFSMILDEGESFLLKGYASTEKGVNDLTGSRITSSKPIGIISGHMRASVPLTTDPKAESKDYLMEMLPPVESWGMNFITIPWANRMSTMYKVVASTGNTLISYEDGERAEVFTLGAGEFKVIDNGRTTGKWYSTAPIMIAQFMARYELPGGSETYDYDPSYVIVQPTDQFVNSVLFKTIGYNEIEYDFRNDNRTNKIDQFEDHYFTIIADSAARDNITLDGLKIKDSFWPTVDPNYFYMNNIINPGDHILESKIGEFSGILFGAGEFDSYSLILGSGLKDRNEDDDENLTQIFTEIYCDSISGIVTDTLGISSGSFNSGIFYVEMNENESFNVEFSQFQTEDNADIVRFGAKVIYPDLDARLVVNYADEDGNFDSYTWDYFGLNVDAKENSGKEEIDFGDLVKGAIIGEKNFYFINTSLSRTVTVAEVIYDESILKLDLSRTLSSELTPGQSISGTLTILGGIEEDIDSEIKIISSCSQTTTIPVKAHFLLEIDARAKGYDFPAIILTEEKLGSLSFSNIGDVDIIIEDQTFPEYPYNVSNTIIGDVVRSGESIIIPVKFNAPENYNNLDDYDFTQDVIITYSGTVNGESKTFSSPLLVTGSVKYPRFISGDIPRLRLRVGEIKSNIINLDNLNDTLAYVSLIKNSSTYSDFPSPDLALLLENTDNVMITKENSANGNYEINFEMNPIQRGEYSFYAFFEYISGDGSGTGPYRRTFSRSGTMTAFLPEASVQDHYLGEINAGLSSSTYLNLFESVSEDNLNLNYLREYEYYFTDEDGNKTEITDPDEISKFPIKIVGSDDGLISDEMSMRESQTISRMVTFAPQEVGEYELILVASHDGGVWDEDILDGEGIPVYYDEISIKAKALRKLIPGVIFEFDEEDYYACRTETLPFSITNIGETDIQITNIIRVDTSGISSDVKSIESPNPIILKKDGVNMVTDRTYYDTLKIYATRQDAGYIDFQLEGIDTLYDEAFSVDTSFYVKPKVFALSVDTVSFGDGREINSLDTMIFSGSLPDFVEPYFEFGLEVEINRDLVEILNKTTQINFTDSEDKKYFSVPALVNYIGEDKYKIDLEDEIKVDTVKLSWNFSLEVKYLYTSITNADIIVENNVDLCFDPVTKILPLKIPEFCIYDYRQISQFLNTSEIYPNPTGKGVNIELSLAREDIINILFINNLGQKFNLVENKFVNEGNHLLYYDLGDLPAGNYLFMIEGGNVYKGKYITITK